ncbi:hypothetical protein OBBRIDRAFT_308976 [Obba rivulosa]|uniref:C2H2-type domain-containing protein n=1 Tax=Obba rivulosa TaxID=1052685 RepID=A0A8E2DPT0_9APHY|nr:hypothetical protein OBBRIDRAFT_308976 [Obba rivulosa]
MNPPTTWICNWNWCSQAFSDSREFSRHLDEEHFGDILRVREKDWDVYLRVHEGQSGTTDSLLAGIPTQSPVTQNVVLEQRASSSRSSSSQSPLLAPSPPRPAEIANHGHEIASSSRSSSVSSTPAPSYPPALPAKASTPARQMAGSSTSFTSFAALFSPAETPDASPLPASPALSHLISDAINSVVHLPASPVGLSMLTPSARAMHAPPTPLPLPRGLRQRASLSPDKPRNAPPPRSPGMDSTNSTQDVEQQLTQLDASPTISHPQLPSLPQSQSTSQPAYPQPYPLLTQPPYRSPADSLAQSTPVEVPLIKTTVPPQATPQPSPPKARLPLPRRTRSRQLSIPPPAAPPARTTRSRSTTPAPAPATATIAPPSAGRTLRSRSKTPSQVLARPPPPPLPRRRTVTKRTPEPSAGHASAMANGAAQAKPVSRRATRSQSIEPTLDTMNIDPPADISSSQQSAASFTSGKLELDPQLVVNGTRAPMHPIPEEDDDDMYADAPPTLKQGVQAGPDSRLPSAGSQFGTYATSQSFGNGYIGSVPLQTQAPYRSQSQSQ